MIKLYRILDWWLNRKRRSTPRRAPARGVLLISSGGLGDTILFSVMIGKFQELARPGEPVHLIIRSECRSVQFLFPPEVQVKPVNYRRFLRNPFYRYRVSMNLRDQGYRLAVSTDHLRLPTIDDAMVFTCQAEETFAMEPRSWPKHDRHLAQNSLRYSRLVKVNPEMAHRLIRWLELINGLTGKEDSPPPVRFDSKRLPPPANVSRPTVVLHPFSAIRERQFSVDIWKKLVASLPSDYAVVLSAAPGDLDRNEEFRELLSLSGLSLDTTSLEEKASLLRAASLVVSVDTSLMHLAVGVGAPTLCLASAAHVVDSVPYDPRITPDNVTFLYFDMPCRGCLGNCILPFEDGRYPCVARLDEDRIIAEVRSLIGERGGGNR